MYNTPENGMEKSQPYVVTPQSLVHCVINWWVFLTFSRLTPVLFTRAWSLAIVSFSLSKKELRGEARFPLRLSETMSADRKPRYLAWLSLEWMFPSGATPKDISTSEISWMNSSLFGNWGNSSGSSMKWLSMSTKHKLACKETRKQENNKKNKKNKSDAQREWALVL